MTRLGHPAAEPLRDLDHRETSIEFWYATILRRRIRCRQRHD
jgi:hypothetical protein